MVEPSDRRGQQHVQGGVDEISRLVVEVALKVVADLPDDHFLLIAGHRNVTGVLLE